MIEKHVLDFTLAIAKNNRRINVFLSPFNTTAERSRTIKTHESIIINLEHLS